MHRATAICRSQRTSLGHEISVVLSHFVKASHVATLTESPSGLPHIHLLHFPLVSFTSKQRKGLQFHSEREGSHKGCNFVFGAPLIFRAAEVKTSDKREGRNEERPHELPSRARLIMKWP